MSPHFHPAYAAHVSPLIGPLLSQVLSLTLVVRMSPLLLIVHPRTEPSPVRYGLQRVVLLVLRRVLVVLVLVRLITHHRDQRIQLPWITGSEALVSTHTG